MTKETKALAPLPAVNIFCKIDHETWRQLTIIASATRMNRGELYAQALTWAANQKAFAKKMVNRGLGRTPRAKK